MAHSRFTAGVILVHPPPAPPSHSAETLSAGGPGQASQVKVRGSSLGPSRCVRRWARWLAGDMGLRQTCAGEHTRCSALRCCGFARRAGHKGHTGEGFAVRRRRKAANGEGASRHCAVAPSRDGASIGELVADTIECWWCGVCCARLLLVSSCPCPSSPLPPPVKARRQHHARQTERVATVATELGRAVSKHAILTGRPSVQ